MTVQSPRRIPILDLIRGVAIVLMLIYHGCFGLSQLGLLQAQFSSDIFWIVFRFIIVSLFLLLVGIGLVLASKKKDNARRYFKRLTLLLVYALLITLVSYLVRPNYFVFFGILHLILVSSLLALPFLNLRAINLVVGVIVFIAGYSFQFVELDGFYARWIGMSTTNLPTDDFAPVFPWFGLVLIGVYLGNTLFSEKNKNNLKSWNSKTGISALLCWSGRHSLHIYFIHFQAFYLLVFLFR